MPITRTKKRKDGLQQYRVRINYTDVSGTARQVERTAYGLQEAQMLEMQLLSEYKETKKSPTARMTIEDLYHEYEKYHANETRATTHATAIKVLKLRVLPFLSGTRLDKLTQPVVAKWKNSISALPLATSTKKTAYKAFSALLNYAVKMEYISKNPLSALGNFRDTDSFSKPADSLHYYSAEQYLKYISQAKAKASTVIDWGYYVFFSIAFYTGARKGEINALKWSDINDNILHIRRSISQKLKGGDVETPPKNKSSYRNLQIPQPLMKILAEHKERQRESHRAFCDDFRICGGEKPLRDTSIENKNKAFSSAAGLPHIRIHDFRHTHASLLVNEGINIQEIARRLGHSDVQMTWSVYSHLYPREEERAVAILDKIE